MELVSKSAEETQKIAEDLAKEILAQKNKENSALVLALEGELGAGKTTFTQGFAKGLKVGDKITSPTFVIFKIYPLRIKSFFRQMIHVDCYRLKDHKELAAIGFKDEIRNKGNIILIEWSDRVQELLPRKYIKIHIDHISEQERKIVII